MNETLWIWHLYLEWSKKEIADNITNQEYCLGVAAGTKKVGELMIQALKEANEKLEAEKARLKEIKGGDFDG